MDRAARAALLQGRERARPQPGPAGASRPTSFPILEKWEKEARGAGLCRGQRRRARPSHKLSWASWDFLWPRVLVVPRPQDALSVIKATRLHPRLPGKPVAPGGPSSGVHEGPWPQSPGQRPCELSACLPGSAGEGRALSLFPRQLRSFGGLMK